MVVGQSFVCNVGRMENVSVFVAKFRKTKFSRNRMSSGSNLTTRVAMKERCERNGFQGKGGVSSASKGIKK